MDGPEVNAAKEAFVLFITTKEVSFVNLVDAWLLFEQAQYYGMISGVKRFPGGDPHISEITQGLVGEHIDSTTASLGHFEFQLATMDPFNHGIGSMLEGLDGDKLEKAIKFCQAMDKVGWRTGDLVEKYSANDFSSLLDETNPLG